MRHRKKGRRLGRSSSHRKAMLRNLATALFLTERDESYYEGLTQADGKSVVNPPRHKGRVITTVQKAKEVKPLVEKCITIAKKALPHEQAAQEFATDAERNSQPWKTWREGDQWQKWNAAMAPAIAARRRAFALLRDKEAVEILFDDVAERFQDRPGGYTRVLKLATVRLGDAGAQAILEFVGVHDRVSLASQKPSFVDDEPAAETPADDEPAAEESSDGDETEASDEVQAEDE
jgi:large subunit ribosomal protein L17